jgi:hypothetical protein
MVNIEITGYYVDRFEDAQDVIFLEMLHQADIYQDPLEDNTNNTGVINETDGTDKWVTYGTWRGGEDIRDIRTNLHTDNGTLDMRAEWHIDGHEAVDEAIVHVGGFDPSGIEMSLVKMPELVTGGDKIDMVVDVFNGLAADINLDLGVTDENGNTLTEKSVPMNALEEREVTMTISNSGDYSGTVEVFCCEVLGGSVNERHLIRV